MESFKIYGQIISQVDWNTYQAKSNITVSTRWTIVRAKEFHRFFYLFFALTHIHLEISAGDSVGGAGQLRGLVGQR